MECSWSALKALTPARLTCFNLYHAKNNNYHIICNQHLRRLLFIYFLRNTRAQRQVRSALVNLQVSTCDATLQFRLVSSLGDLTSLLYPIASCKHAIELYVWWVISYPMQEVDGESLLTLDPEMMVKLMNIKAGPSLRIHNKIMQLKKQNNILQ